MDVPLKHIIGTVALIGLVIAAGLSYTVFTSYIEIEVTKSELNQVAEYVALNLVEIANLINFANTTLGAAGRETFYAQIKILKLPTDLAGKAYTIQLAGSAYYTLHLKGTETSLVIEQSDEQGYHVQAQLVTRNDVTAKSLIPLNSTQTHLIFVTDKTTIIDETYQPPTIIIDDGEGTLEVKGDNTKKVFSSSLVYGGAQEIVVWGLKYSNTTWVGIGLWK